MVERQRERERERVIREEYNIVLFRTLEGPGRDSHIDGRRGKVGVSTLNYKRPCATLLANDPPSKVHRKDRDHLLNWNAALVLV